MSFETWVDWSIRTVSMLSEGEGLVTDINIESDDWVFAPGSF